MDEDDVIKTSMLYKKLRLKKLDDMPIFKLFILQFVVVSVLIFEFKTYEYQIIYCIRTEFHCQFYNGLPN
jgi:hypothetical protein